MTTRKIAMPELTMEQLRVHRAGEALHRDGASPSGALELLASLVEDRAWERLVDVKGRSFKGRFRDFVGAREPYGLHFDAEQLPKVIGLRHPHESDPEVAARMEVMRGAVRELLNAEIPAITVHGGRTITQRGTRDGGTNSSPTSSNDSSYVLSRLKRDDPDLAERVVRGEVTPNAAARSKGWRKARILVSTPERTAESLRKHMPLEARQTLARLLLEE